MHISYAHKIYARIRSLINDYYFFYQLSKMLDFTNNSWVLISYRLAVITDQQSIIIVF